MTWDSTHSTLKITNKRIDKLKYCIYHLLHLPFCTVRDLHSVVGQIISLSPAVGNVARVMTRYCQIVIATAQNESKNITLDNRCRDEIKFWHNYSAAHLNTRYVFSSPKVHTIICTDASSVASGAIVSLDNNIAHKNWSPSEKTQSSTWRELETIWFALNSFNCLLQNSRVKLFTDSQTAAKIMEVGSMKTDLQSIVIQIFDLSLKHRIFLEVQWITRSLNEQADCISKWVDTDDWSLSDTFLMPSMIHEIH